VINALHFDDEFLPGLRRAVGVSSARNYEGKREEGLMVRNAIMTDGTCGVTCFTAHPSALGRLNCLAGCDSPHSLVHSFTFLSLIAL
jgi:hypothetical protein